ncbi:unnamed protein product, partial [Polarella glacialis]
AIADQDRIAAWLARLPREIPWCGERLPSITQKVFFELLRAERCTPGAAQKVQILAEQDGRCVECGGVFDGDIEWDHIVPLRQTVQGAPQVFQAICASCHMDKTQLSGSQARTLNSSFSAPVWEAYVSSPRPPPLVWSAHEHNGNQLCELDVRRCRRSALCHSAHDFPVFSPFDSIKRAVAGELCDFTFVALRPGKRSALNLLPWVGPMWYHKVAVEHMLHYGICTWNDCHWSLEATSHIPKECLTEPLLLMEEAWGSEKDLAKFSVNSMVGLWATTPSCVYSVVTSNSAADAEGAMLKRIVEYGDGLVTHDHIKATKLIQNSSMRPIHDLIMAVESSRMAQLVFVLKALGVPQRSIVDVKTDAITLTRAQKMRSALIAVSGTSFAQLPGLRRKFERTDINQRFLDDNEVYPAGCTFHEEVFRFSDREVKLLQGNYKTLKRECESPAELPPWRDLTQDEAIEAVMRGEGLLLLGAPGTGKTHLLRELMVQLREAGKRVDCIAKTHCATKNMGCDAVTADHWVRKHVRAGSFSSQILVVEELSQVDVQLWGDLCLVSMKGTTNICCGDFGQFQAVSESWAGCPVQEGALERSDMLLDMCNGNRLTLTENKRSDQKLFGFYTGLRCGTPDARDLRESVEEARRLFPATDLQANFTLTMSHKRRVQVNRFQNQLQKPESAIFIRAPAPTRAGNQPQSMWLWDGLQLIGAGGRCLKGLFFTVQSVTEDSVLLEGQTLTHQEAVRSLRLSYGLTFASCQGLTLPGRVGLETESPNMTLRHLYLFSGTGSVGRAFNAIGWEVISVDMDPKSNASIITDIGAWDYKVFEPGVFQCVFASPPYTHYSRARTTATTPRDLVGSDRLVQTVLDIIEYHKPASYFIENPQTGLLKSRDVVRGLSYSDTCYCKYGMKYRKSTRIWHNNFDFEPETMCCNKSPCEAAKLGRHEATAQRGPGGLRGQSDRCSLNELYSMPALLCDHIAAAASAALGG